MGKTQKNSSWIFFFLGIRRIGEISIVFNYNLEVSLKLP